MIEPAAVLRVLWFFVPAYLANMSPVLVQHRFARLAVPMDGGRTFRGRRLLGDHKTWRGLIAGIVVGTGVYELQRLVHAAGLWADLALIDYAAHPLLPGFLMGLGTGVGDAIKSFFKRRVDIPPGASWAGFVPLGFLVGAFAVAATAIGWALGLKEAWI